MDSYFPKTRRPIASLSNPLKRPPPSVTPPKASKIPNTPTTPKDARLVRPKDPPPIKSKLQQMTARRQIEVREKRKPISIRELFESVHQQEDESLSSIRKDRNKRKDSDHPNIESDNLPFCTPLDTSKPAKTTVSSRLFSSDKELESTPISHESTFQISTPLVTRLHKETPSREKTPAPAAPTESRSPPVSPNKIACGPLKGVSASLLDIIRAKEAAAKAIQPELERRTELLGLAPSIVRIVPTIFTSSKKEILLYDKVIEKCSKSLNSSYTTATIIECLDLLEKVVPDWISTVSISRGKFMRINKSKYTIPQLLQAITRYKKTVGDNYKLL